jgi:hypothetical protein
MRNLAALLLPALLSATVVVGCGKKGPPLAPIVRSPDRLKDLHARRLGEAVRAGFTIPDANTDKTQPADLARVEVYAYTAMKVADVDDLKRATLVASVPVQRPVTLDEEARWKKNGVPPPPNPGQAQGALASVSETITPDMLVALAPDVIKGSRPKVPVVPAGPVVTPPLTGPVPEPFPSRFYVAYGVSRKGRKGPLSPRPGVPMLPPPARPEGLTAIVGETTVTLTWKPPVTERRPIQEPASGEVLPATPKGVPTNVVYLYNVYLVNGATGSADEPGVPVAIAPEAMVPLNPIVVEALTFEDQGFTFGIERCYAVRAVEPTGPSRPRPADPAALSIAGTPPAETAVVMPSGTPPIPPPGVAEAQSTTRDATVLPGASLVLSSGTPPIPPPGTAGEPLGGSPVVAATSAPVVPAAVPAPATVAAVTPPITKPSVPAGGASSVEGDPSAPTCVTPVDVFPPPVPASLGAVASEGAVSLIWESVVATDLAGYLVLRADTAEGPFMPLFDEPIRETTYRDGTAKPGVRYIYVVASADTAIPRNVSSPSNRVEESAR